MQLNAKKSTPDKIINFDIYCEFRGREGEILPYKSKLEGGDGIMSSELAVQVSYIYLYFIRRDKEPESLFSIETKASQIAFFECLPPLEDWIREKSRP